MVHNVQQKNIFFAAYYGSRNIYLSAYITTVYISRWLIFCAGKNKKMTWFVAIIALSGVFLNASGNAFCSGWQAMLCAFFAPLYYKNALSLVTNYLGNTTGSSLKCGFGFIE